MELRVWGLFRPQGLGFHWGPGYSIQSLGFRVLGFSASAGYAR